LTENPAARQGEIAVPDVPDNDAKTQRRASPYIPYVIPLVICIAGVILLFTIALAPIGIIVLLIGVAWGALVGYLERNKRRADRI
jgi:hypothetical protein